MPRDVDHFARKGTAMRRFGLVSVAAVLLAAGSVSAQTVVNVTTVKDGKGKITTLGPAAPGGAVPVMVPGPGVVPPLGAILHDQPALLARLGLSNCPGGVCPP